MRLASALLAVASLVSAVKGHWLEDIPRTITMRRIPISASLG